MQTNLAFQLKHLVYFKGLESKFIEPNHKTWNDSRQRIKLTFNYPGKYKLLLILTLTVFCDMEVTGL